MNDVSVVMKFDNLTEYECFELTKSIMDILKENDCEDYEVRFGTSDNSDNGISHP